MKLIVWGFCLMLAAVLVCSAGPVEENDIEDEDSLSTSSVQARYRRSDDDDDDDGDDDGDSDKDDEEDENKTENRREKFKNKICKLTWGQILGCHKEGPVKDLMNSFGDLAKFKKETTVLEMKDWFRSQFEKVKSTIEACGDEEVKNLIKGWQEWFQNCKEKIPKKKDGFPDFKKLCAGLNFKKILKFFGGNGGGGFGNILGALMGGEGGTGSGIGNIVGALMGGGEGGKGGGIAKILEKFMGGGGGGSGDRGGSGERGGRGGRGGKGGKGGKGGRGGRRGGGGAGDENDNN